MASRARQILLLCALTLSVLGMHHVALPPHQPGHAVMAAEPVQGPPAMPMTDVDPATQPAGGSGNGTGHDLLHLCLVVLCAAAVFLLATWLLATVRTTAAATGDRRSRRPRVVRPVAGRALLASVCVLRL